MLKVSDNAYIRNGLSVVTWCAQVRRNATPFRGFSSLNPEEYTIYYALE